MSGKQMTREEIRQLCLNRIGNALERDEFDDVAKLVKDTLSVFAKEDQTRGAREAVHFQMVASFADETERRRYVESTQPGIAKLLAPSVQQAEPA